MRLTTKITTLTAALSLMAAPAFAVDGSDHPSGAPEGIPPSYGGTDNPGTSHVPTREEARALGREECQEFKNNFGENKSQFGKCVAAAAKTLRAGVTPREACGDQELSRKPAEGEHRSDFSACVEAAARALKEQNQSA